MHSRTRGWERSGEGSLQRGDFGEEVSSGSQRKRGGAWSQEGRQGSKADFAGPHPLFGEARWLQGPAPEPQGICPCCEAHLPTHSITSMKLNQGSPLTPPTKYLIYWTLKQFFDCVILVVNLSLCNHSFWWLGGKESACHAEDVGSIPGLRRSPGEENGNPLQYSCLESPMNRGGWWATVHGISKESDMT